MKPRALLSMLAVFAAATIVCAGEEPNPLDPFSGADPQRVKEAFAKKAEEERKRAEDEHAQQLKKAEEEHQVAFERFRMMQRDLQQLSGRTDVSDDGLQRTAARLDDQLEALLLEDAGSKARIETLARSIAEMRKKAEVDAERDDVVEELKKLVVMREKALGYTKELTNKGAAATAELDKASIDLSEAKIRLAERQRAVSATAGSEALAAWNKELINLSVGEQERRARREALEKRLSMIRRALDLLPQLQYEQERMKAVRARLLGLNYPAQKQ